MIEDATLLRRFAEEGSNDAFTELVQRHLNLVYSAALRQTRDKHKASDIAQLVFIAAARDAAALSKHPVFPAWLYSATRNAAINQMRAERRRRTREKEAHTMEELTSPSTPTPNWGLIQPVLDEAMHELAEPDREAVLLRFFQGKSYSEVAAALRISEEAARKRVDRALDKLGAVLGRRGLTSTVVSLAAVLANEVSVAAPSGLAATITASVTAGAGASGALALMSMSKISVGILIAGMAATGAAIYEHRQLVQTESVLANVTGEYEAQAKQAAEAKSLLAKTEAALPAAQRDLRLEAEKNGSGASQSSSSGLSNGDFDFEQFLRGLAKDPAFAPLWHRHQLRQINRRFGELFLTLKLPADQLAKLRQLLIDRDEAAYDARDEAKKDGLGATATARAVTQAMGEVNSDIKTLIGADAYDQIQSEPIISGLKRTVQQQAGADLAAAGVPLSDDQLFALANIYFDVEVPGKNHSFGTLPMAAPPDTTTGLTPKNATILSQATRFLTAAQIPVLRQSLTEASEEEGYLIKSAAQGGPVFKIYGSPHP